MAMTEEEIKARIASIDAALEAIELGGQDYTINSGGSVRAVTQADYKTLVARKEDLLRKLDEIQNGGSFNIGAAW